LVLPLAAICSSNFFLGFQVLFEAFPVQNTDAGRAEQDAALQMQFDAMLELLNDAEVSFRPDLIDFSHRSSRHCITPFMQVRVRALAVEGCCRVVAQYWSLLPAQAARAPLLQRIFALAADAASATVLLFVYIYHCFGIRKITFLCRFAVQCALVSLTSWRHSPPLLPCCVHCCPLYRRC
jgi:hypothetical protein